MRLAVDRVLEGLAGWLVPPRCVLCEGRGQRPTLDLCVPCQSELPGQSGTCPRCALRPVPADGYSECSACRADPPPYDRCHAPYRYEAPLDGLIHELKYDGHLAVARVLGTLLGRSVRSQGLQHEVEVLLPVPLHPAKLAERGFNQSLEIARWVSRETARPCEWRALRRLRRTRPQVGLALEARLANLHGAFAVTGGVQGRRIAVIDDVMTTGSTLRECAWVLRRAGAASVDVWCVARTPL
jgi:ComF family protein